MKEKNLAVELLRKLLAEQVRSIRERILLNLKSSRIDFSRR